MKLVDQFGRPMESSRDRQMMLLRSENRMLKAKMDAAQTTEANTRHWANADQLDPFSATNADVRRKLRMRSRYELIENNPYLKGILLTVANDFVGSGPKLQILEDSLIKTTRNQIQNDWWEWCEAVKLRQKLWRMRMAKCVDGEAFAILVNNERVLNDVKLDLYLVEADQVASTVLPVDFQTQENEIDGVKFDRFHQPVAYHVLYQHPGAGSTIFKYLNRTEGEWINADYVVHWFRQDRGWLRGIPELTPSLPLCALLRRYTLAVVRAAEVAASFSAVVETEGPVNPAAWTDGHGNLLDDDPFDLFPIEMGMVTTLPWGYKLKQLAAEQPTTMYDAFVNALLREICRPILVPFNMASGTSKDSNMASGVLDSHIYKSGQKSERYHCQESVLAQVFRAWWAEYVRLTGRFNRIGGYRTPYYAWRWDQIGVEHTDPLKVWNAISEAHKAGFLLDRDIQETYFNRDVEDWRNELQKDAEFRREEGLYDYTNTSQMDAADPMADPLSMGMVEDDETDSLD